MPNPESPTPIPAAAAPPARRRLLIISLKLAVLAAFVYFWVVAIRAGLPDFRTMDWAIAPGAVAASCAVYALASVLFGVLWSPLLREVTGIHLGPLRAFRASMFAWILRYVPGKVWAPAAKAFFSCADKADAPPVAIAMTVEMLLYELGGLLLALIALPWTPGLTFMREGARLGSAVFLALCFVLSWPPVFTRIANLALRLLRQPPLPRRPRYRVLLLLLLGYMGVFALYSISFIMLARALTPVRAADWPTLIGAFSSAWVFGVLVFLAPAGLGARETGLAGLLRQVTVWPMPLIAKLLVYSRLVTLVVELACAAAAAALPSVVSAVSRKKNNP